MRVVVDAFGGDNAPLEIIKGAAIASVMGQLAAFLISIGYVIWKKERIVIKKVPYN